MTQKTFIFIGRSGCGKGTQVSLLMEYLNKLDAFKEILYIQSGQEFREFIKGDSETQKLSKAIYDIGGLQPEFLAVHIWSHMLIQKYNKNKHIIFDGTPRKYHESGVLDSIRDFYSLENPFVINIDISKEESIKRLMARGRMDDNEKEIEKRLSWYETDVLPAIEFYKKSKNYTFLNIDGERSIEKIHEDLMHRLALK